MGFRKSFFTFALVTGGSLVGGAIPGGSIDLAAAGAVAGLIAAFLLMLGRTP
jgi:hypothetical protein